MPGPRIVLVRSKDSANVGAAARAMKNFGLDDLVLVAPRCRIDARARALASHAGDVLDGARVVASVAEAIGDLRFVLGTSARRRDNESLPVWLPRQAAPHAQGSDVAILFGPEDHGLSNEELDLCQGYVSIPTADYASLNLAQAVLLVAYEVHLARPREGRSEAGPHAAVDGPSAQLGVPPTVERAPREQLERFYAQLVDAFHLIGYTDAQRERAILRLYRGIFDRVALTPREVAALRGLVSQVAWAAEQPPERLPDRKDER
ncbi:MAG: RNA methyltransferase [Deinococcales bacterium]